MKASEATAIILELFAKELQESKNSIVNTIEFSESMKTGLFFLASSDSIIQRLVKVIPQNHILKIHMNTSWFRGKYEKPVAHYHPFEYYVLLWQHNGEYYYHLCHLRDMLKYVFSYNGNPAPFINQSRWNAKIVQINNQFLFKWSTEWDTERMITPNNLAEMAMRDFYSPEIPVIQPSEDSLNSKGSKYGNGGTPNSKKHLKLIVLNQLETADTDP